MTFESFALGNSNDINHLILGEYITDWKRLLHVFTSPVNLLRHCATVQLDLHDVRFLLTTLHQPHLTSHHTDRHPVRHIHITPTSTRLESELLNMTYSR